MERTLIVNYPVLRQNNGVLLNTFEKHHGRKIQHCTSIREARRDIPDRYNVQKGIYMTVFFYERIQ